MKTRLDQQIATRDTEKWLTHALTIGGLVLTVIGIAGGVWLAHQPVSQPIPGSRTGPWPFLSNALANLILIGPALVVSNVLVAYVRRTRSDNRAAQHVALIGMLLTSSINVANDFLAILGSEKRCAQPKVITDEGKVDLRGTLAAIDAAAETAKQASAEFAAKTADSPPRSLPVPGDSISHDLPNFNAVQTEVTLLDREIPCHFTVLSASTAEYFSRFCYVDFVWEPANPQCIVEPKIGFPEISVWMLRAGSTSGRISLDLRTYQAFVFKCLFAARTVLDTILRYYPKRLLPQPTADGSTESANLKTVGQFRADTPRPRYQPP
jgi:hypothetical protein